MHSFYLKLIKHHPNSLKFLGRFSWNDNFSPAILQIWSTKMFVLNLIVTYFHHFHHFLFSLPLKWWLVKLLSGTGLYFRVFALSFFSEEIDIIREIFAKFRISSENERLPCVFKKFAGRWRMWKNLSISAKISGFVLTVKFLLLFFNASPKKFSLTKWIYTDL